MRFHGNTLIAQWAYVWMLICLSSRNVNVKFHEQIENNNAERIFSKLQTTFQGKWRGKYELSNYLQYFMRDSAVKSILFILVFIIL